MNGIDFTHPPSRVSEYEFGQPVTRDNFLSFLLMSYMASRGAPAVQRIFFLFAEKRTGFEFLETFKSFAECGGFDRSFSKEEQGIFLAAFNRIKRHHEKVDPAFIEEEMRDELVRWHEDYNYQKVNADAITYFDFEKIATLADFTSAAAPYLKQWKETSN